ncbi:prohibitin family protein [Xanthomonas sacchari]|nr:SPFH domain-containing protein [Xanthomonas sacchari]
MDNHTRSIFMGILEAIFTNIFGAGRNAKIAKYVFVAILCFILLLIFYPFYLIPNGTRGVLMNFGKAEDQPISEGIHVRIPIMQSVYKMPIQIQRSDTKAEAASRDLQRVTSTISLNYHVAPGEVVKVYRSTGVFENIDDRIISPAVMETLKAVTAKYSAEQLVTERHKVSTDIKSSLIERLTRHGVVIDEFSITDFNFGEDFEKAITNKVVAEQKKLTADRDLLRIKVEADQKIQEARGRAESAKLDAEAQAVALRSQRDAVSAELIELRKVETQKAAVDKWDGKLPGVMSGALPFINIDKAGKPAEK